LLLLRFFINIFEIAQVVEVNFVDVFGIGHYFGCWCLRMVNNKKMFMLMRRQLWALKQYLILSWLYYLLWLSKFEWIYINQTLWSWLWMSNIKLFVTCFCNLLDWAFCFQSFLNYILLIRVAFHKWTRFQLWLKSQSWLYRNLNKWAELIII
jgi:hypothetical protein